MATYDFPSNIFPVSEILAPIAATTVFDSRTGGTQTGVRSGSHWGYQLQFRNIRRDRIHTFDAAIARLNGPQHRMRSRIFSYSAPRGKVSTLSSSVIPRVNGGTIKGTTLTTDAWGAGSGNLFEPGDLIEIQYKYRDADGALAGDATAERTTSNPVEGRLHRVVTAVTWAASASLEVWPPITVSPDDDARIIVKRPQETWILANNQGESNSYTTETTRSISLITDLLVVLAA